MTPGTESGEDSRLISKQQSDCQHILADGTWWQFVDFALEDVQGTMFKPHRYLRDLFRLNQP